MSNEDFEESGTVYEGSKKLTFTVGCTMSFRELAVMFKETKELKEGIEEKLEVINGKYDALRMELLPAAMEKEGLQSPVKLAGIGKISVTPDLQVSVMVGCKFALADWLRSHGLGDIVQPTINASTLKSFVVRRMKKGDEVPDEFLNINPIQRASLLKL